MLGGNRGLAADEIGMDADPGELCRTPNAMLWIRGEDDDLGEG